MSQGNMSHKSRMEMILFAMGRAGSIHAGNLIRNTQVHLKWIVEQFPEKAEKFVAENFLATKVVHMSETNHVLADKSVQAVVITSPTDQHEELIVQCVRAGKHVFCEKPIALTYEAVERCYEEAEKFGRTLFCAFNRRFDPTHRSVAQRTKAGEVGQVQTINMISRDSPYPKVSVLANLGNLFYDNAIHDVDTMLNITGEAPVTVLALAHAFHADMAAIGDVDTAGVMLKFPSGVIGHIDLSRDAAYGYDQRLEVFGSKGMLQSQNLQPTGVLQSNEKGITSDKIHFSFPTRFAEAFAAEMEHFIDIITKNVEAEITKESVLRVVRTVEAIHKSWKTGQQVTMNNNE